MERKQARGLAQARGWDEETHMGKDPSDPVNDNRKAKQSFRQKNISTS